MTTTNGIRTIRLESMTRVEGEGGLRIEVRDGRLQDVRLDIYEPPRMFEAFLRGRSLREVPDITARICGICPVAYQMSSVQAIESALEITPGPEIQALRRLLYCGEWIQSHALHIYLLQAPDFFGMESAVELAAKQPDLVRRGLDLKKIGNELMEAIGGRSVHPVSVCVGGFWKVPRRSELLALRGPLEWALQASLETVKFVSSLKLPEFAPDYECVALSHPREYAMNAGHIVSSAGLDIPVKEFEQVFLEMHVAHSTALHSVRAERGSSYLVGPLSRVNLNLNHLSPAARQAADQSGVTWPCFNPYAGIVARAVELVMACEESLRLIDAYREPEPPRLEYTVRAAEGCAATEAPRGLLYHRYRINDQGMVQTARIVPPTAQNYRRMEDDLRLLIPGILERTDAEIVDECERLVRNYDPCISCSTHALKLRITRQ
ncbi:MAG: Ni/Fe hydrogenase subunit alpha [Terracidiphilus sp.]|jgi:coenzyme F420-reducing hydrogenase alpha subunit